VIQERKREFAEEKMDEKDDSSSINKADDDLILTRKLNHNST